MPGSADNRRSLTVPDSKRTVEPVAQVPSHQVRAVYNDRTIRVYQAYSDQIADSALRSGTFLSPPFNAQRMTWIKPSFLWMACRAGWGEKEEKQKRILAIDITREGFEWALGRSRLTHDALGPHMCRGEKLESMRASYVLVQWDPERDLFCSPQPWRTIQVGIRDEAVRRYVHDWIVKISDVTALAGRIHDCVAQGHMSPVVHLLPKEREYPLGPELQERLGIVASGGYGNTRVRSRIEAGLRRSSGT
jgi:hypothetical protein